MTDDRRKDLKIQALLEKIGSISSSYENQIAELRVELTLNNENYTRHITELQQQIDESGKESPTEDAEVEVA